MTTPTPTPTPTATPTQTPELLSLTDLQLVEDLKQLVQRERSITLAVLLRLVEVERRRIHLVTDSSVFSYCVNQLGYSRSAACRRIQAARCLRDYPVVEEMLGDGRVNLTTIGLISRVLTRENAGSLLKRIAGRSEAEVARIAAAHGHGARANLADRIRPIRNRPEDTGVDASPPLAGVGERTPRAAEPGTSVPCDGGEGASPPRGGATAQSMANRDGVASDAGANCASSVFSSTDPATSGVGAPDRSTANTATTDVSSPCTRTQESSTNSDGPRVASPDGRSHLSGTVRPGLPDAGSSGSTANGHDSRAKEPASFRIEFTARQSLVAKLEHVRALQSRSRPGVSIGVVFEACLDEYLKKHDPTQRDARRRARREKRKSRSEKAREDAGLARNTGAEKPSAGLDTASEATESVAASSRQSTEQSPSSSRQSAAGAPSSSLHMPDEAPWLSQQSSAGAPWSFHMTAEALSPSRQSAAGAPSSSLRSPAEAPSSSLHSSAEVPSLSQHQSAAPAPSPSRQSPARSTSVSSSGQSAPSFAFVADPARVPSRHIPAALRDLVWIRDRGQCAYRGPDGTRCTETHGLEVDHVDPWALGGPTVLWNLRLVCAPHNQLHADRTFGRDFMERKRQARTETQPKDHTRPGCDKGTRNGNRAETDSAGAG